MPDAILPPMTYDMGVAVLHHGERSRELDPENPDACLCGRYLDYLMCPDAFSEWRGITLYPAEED